MEERMSLTNPQIKRRQWIDVLKGIAIILVVYGHNTSDNSFLQCFHMPLFFILSGFIFSPKPIKDYFHKTINRLLLPYCSFLISIFLLDILAIIHDTNLLSWSTSLDACNALLLKLLYGGEFLKESYAVFWFISVLWFSTNLFNCILKYEVTLYFLPLLILIGYLMQIIPFALPYNIQVVPMATSYIWIGFLLKKVFNEKRIHGWENHKLFFLLMAFLVIYVVFILRKYLALDMKYNFYGTPFISLVSSILASVSIAIIALFISKKRHIAEILSYIGLASMSIMYLHMPVKFMFLSRIGLKDNHFICIIAGIIISLLLYEQLKRFNFTKKYFLGM